MPHRAHTGLESKAGEPEPPPSTDVHHWAQLYMNAHLQIAAQWGFCVCVCTGGRLKMLDVSVVLDPWHYQQVPFREIHFKKSSIS